MSPPRVSLSPSNLSATLICDVLVNASVICSPNLSSKISSPRRLTSMKKDFASVSEIQKESQQSVSPSSSQVPLFAEDTGGSGKVRRTWTPTDDVVLISSSLAFWKRIAAYYNASPKLAGCEKREASHCKNRWQKINDVVCKFCGAYEAATRQKTSGQNDNDKWCELSTAKKDGSYRKRKCDGGDDDEANAGDDDEATNRPPGVKAAKAGSGKGSKCPEANAGKGLSQFQTMWTIKKEDLVLKEKLGKIKLLNTLLAREGPLAASEETLKEQLITELRP
ncbi:glutathione S-transferase T3-like [Brassica rapa]|uniref:glutathione S-transferase T3-like n=1 Tax=Brassica campestris TaxID=3711 RepID=UPI00142D9527|nr:glutathione S-transferase T3-like [Brassica rapa]